MHELKDVLRRCETEDSLYKDEICQGNVGLEPLVVAYMEKSRLCVESLNGMEEINEDLIEDVKAHADSVDFK